jgi:hypothetical protein
MDKTEKFKAKIPENAATGQKYSGFLPMLGKLGSSDFCIV